jgi:type VI secretion system protein ImpC
MLPAVSTEDDDKKKEGGIVFGGVSFGVGGSPMPASGQKPAAGPREVDLGEALMPLRVVCVADLVPHPEHNAGASAPAEAIRVEPGQQLDDLFGRLRPRISVEVESVLAEGKKQRIEIAPTGMKSFRPDGLVREVPILRSLLDGLRALERLRDGTMNVDQARAELDRLWVGSSFVARVLGGVEVRGPKGAAPAPAPAKASDGDVSRILDMIDTGTRADATSVANDTAAVPAPAAAQEGGAKGMLQGLISALVSSGREQARPDNAIRLVEKALGLQLGAILQHPEVRRIEQAWRGLHLFVSRAPKTAVVIDVVSARPEEAADALERTIRAGTGVESPISFAVVDAGFDSSAASLARLRALADVGESYAVPVVTNATPELFGKQLDEVDRLDNKAALFEAPERAPWRAEAHRPAMLWLTLALNRVFARAAYDEKTSRVREAKVSEQPADDDRASVWMQPCWAVAALAARSFEKTGWPCRITGGGRDGGVLEDLTVRQHQVASSSERIAIPTEAFFSTETQKALSRIGLLALASQPNSDQVYLLSAPTAYVTPPKKTYDSATTEPEMRLPQTPLGDQLFVARIAQFLRALGGRIPPGSPPEEVREVLEGALWELFGTQSSSGMELKIDVRDRGGELEAGVTVRPRRFLGVQTEEVSLGVPLG